MKSILISILLIAFATAAAAQNKIKLFDPVSINWSDPNVLLNSDPYGMYKSAQVYLSCSSSRQPTATLSGPDGGKLIVDNRLTVNGTNVCPYNCFAGSTNPLAHIGMPVEMGYIGLDPIDISEQITGTGLYTFNLLDFGQLYGSSSVYLSTSCSIIPIYTPREGDTTSTGTVCHRSNGDRGSQTLTVGGGALTAHLAHGDTAGPCEQ
jgi:hypothetical protein